MVFWEATVLVPACASVSAASSEMVIVAELGRPTCKLVANFLLELDWWIDALSLAVMEDHILICERRLSSNAF